MVDHYFPSGLWGLIPDHGDDFCFFFINIGLVWASNGYTLPYQDNLYTVLAFTILCSFHFITNRFHSRLDLIGNVLNTGLQIIQLLKRRTVYRLETFSQSIVYALKRKCLFLNVNIIVAITLLLITMTVCKVSFLILHASFHNIYLSLLVAYSMWTNASEMRRLDQILAQLCLFKTYWLSNNSDDRRMFD